MNSSVEVEVSPHASFSSELEREQRPRPARRFEFGMAIAFLVTALCGFAPSYYLKAAFPTPPLPPLVHVHALLFTSWLVLLLVQSGLIRAHRVDLHRRFGLAGAALALAMMPVGLSTAIHAARTGITAAGKNPMDLLVFQVGALLLFGGFVVAAVVLRKRPEAHRRLMLLATVSIIPPAIARVPLVGMRPVLALLLSTTFVLAGVVHDLKVRGRVHPTYVWGGLLILFSGPVRFLVGQTSAWHAFARFLVG